MQRRWFRLQRKSYSAGSTLGEPLAALASSPAHYVRENEPTLSGGAKPSFVAWLEFGFSGFLCGSFSAPGSSKHGIFGGISRGMQANGWDCVCQNRTPRKEKPRRSGAGVLSVMRCLAGEHSRQLTDAVSVPMRRTFDRCDGARRSRLPTSDSPDGAIVASGRLAIGKEGPAEAGLKL